MTTFMQVMQVMQVMEAMKVMDKPHAQDLAINLLAESSDGR